MIQPFLPTLILVSAFVCSIPANAGQHAAPPETNESPWQLHSPETGRRILDEIHQRRSQLPPEEGVGQSQAEQNSAHLELRPSLLTLPGTGLLAQQNERLGQLTSAMSTETQVTKIPDGWFRKTAYAWSVGDDYMLNHQIQTAIAKSWPWGVILSVFLLSAYLDRRRKSKPRRLL